MKFTEWWSVNRLKYQTIGGAAEAAWDAALKTSERRKTVRAEAKKDDQFTSQSSCLAACRDYRAGSECSLFYRFTCGEQACVLYAKRAKERV